jgi:hypothetical protein
MDIKGSVGQGETASNDFSVRGVYCYIRKPILGEEYVDEVKTHTFARLAESCMSEKNRSRFDINLINKTLLFHCYLSAIRYYKIACRGGAANTVTLYWRGSSSDLNPATWPL